MSAGTAHPDASWRWLSFLSRQELPPPGNTQLGPEVVPARRSQLEGSAAWRRANAEQREALTVALERPATSYEAQVVARRVALALAEALRAVLDDGQSPEVALASAQATFTGAPVAAAPTTITPPPAVATPRPIPAGEVVIIRYLPFYQDSEFIRPYVERFNAENPDIRVELREIGGNEFTPATFAELADVFFWWGGSLDASELTSTLDLQPLIDADLAFNLADYPAGLLDPYRRGGKLYGLPQTVYLANIGYNADLFAAAGVSPPPPTWTIDEFAAVARELTATGGGPPRYGFGALASDEGLLWYVANSGAQLVLGEGDALQPNFADPAVRSALREGIDLLRTTSPNRYIGYSPASFNRDDGSYRTLLDGSVALWWDSGLTFMPNLPRQAAFQRGMLPLPRDGAGNTAASVGLIGLHISAQTKHPDAAWRWLRFLATEVPTRYSGFPARSSLAESTAFREAAPLGSADVYAAYKPLLEQALQQEYLYRIWQVQPYWLFRAADRALQGGDLDNELTDAQFFTEQYLACVRGGEREGVCARQVDPSYDGELLP
jgi:ABC-type glycerol-3-phosphate transport system substrate-binding protein